MNAGPRVALRPARRGARVALGAALAWLVASVLVWNLPDGALRPVLLPAATPVVHGLALEQRWALFSPDPRDRSVWIEVGVVFADGGAARIELPDEQGTLRDVRWRKWVTRVERQDRQHLWSAAASWFARSFGGPGVVREITLTRRSSRTPPPGSGEARTWDAFEFYRRSFLAREPGP